MKRLALILAALIAAMTVTVTAAAAGDRVQTFTLAGGGNSNAAAAPAPTKKGISHEKIIELAKEAAEETGLEWLDAPTESFDPAVSADGLESEETKGFFERTFERYKDGGYSAVYVEITQGRYGGNVIVMYQG